jgi:exo-1,4-beta-D-glucosaminidase
MGRRLLGVMGVAVLLSPAASQAAERLALASWSRQSSARVQADGRTLSTAGYADAAWHHVRVPNTVLGALVDIGVHPDPYFGMNLRAIPGTTYPIGTRFTLIETPADSPFKPSWWYRTEFDVSADRLARSRALHLDGLNYRANVWVNGRKIGDARDVVGAFRAFEFDVTDAVRPGRNAVAVEVFGPGPQDLAFMWVDWNPTPADKNMGLWQPAYVTESGPLALRHPHVVSDLDLPSLDVARLRVSTEVWNTTDKPVSGTVRGTIGDIRFAKDVTLAAGARTTVRLTPVEVPALTIESPRIWWPYRYGAQEMYTLELAVETAGAVSDDARVRFGIQEMSDELTKEGHRLFRVNGRPILVRGGGWASDMLLRPASRERLRAEMRYVREMGLNTIRLEGKLETDEFYDLADEMGILLMAGWCCCDHWETWDKWDAEDHRVGPASLHTQSLRLRNHPSVLVWLNGSDFPPPAKVEKAYLDVLKERDWPKPVLSNATEQPGPVSGPSGVKMRGPYDYVPPSYWLKDKDRGGAFGFNTEMGPGAAVPPIESLRAMLPADKLWPINDVWRFHAGGDEFKDLRLSTEALEARYGKATSAEDYARKSQALSYEGQRAMMEAFGRNKYTATGVIQWMLNNAWPSMIWHLYDWYLRPAGGYFGTKKAGRPLNAQYSYDDRSIAVVNDTQQAHRGLRLKVQLLDLDLKPRFSEEKTVDVGPDGVVRALVLPAPAPDLTTTYFVRLDLSDASGRWLGDNFYWLSTREDVVDWKDLSKWWYTPTKRHADLTALASLPATTLTAETRLEDGTADEGAAVVKLRNTGTGLAFQTRLRLLAPGTDEEILPVYWDDNYIALLPGETRDVRVSWPRDKEKGTPRVTAEAWNAPPVRAGGDR